MKDEHDNGRYRNVFLEDYSELKMEIAELDTLIEDLSAYLKMCWQAMQNEL